MATKKKRWSVPTEIHGGKAKSGDSASALRSSQNLTRGDGAPVYPEFPEGKFEVNFHINRFLDMGAHEAFWRLNNIVMSSKGEKCESNMRISCGLIWIKVADKKGLPDLTNRGYALVDTGFQTMSLATSREMNRELGFLKSIVADWKKQVRLPLGVDPYNDETWFELLPPNQSMDFLAQDYLGYETNQFDENGEEIIGERTPHELATAELSAGRRRFALLLFQESLKQSRAERNDAAICRDLLATIPLLMASNNKKEAKAHLAEALKIAEKLGDSNVLALAKQHQTNI